jgi:hypothetical protein
VNPLLARYRRDRDQCARTAQHNLDAVTFYDTEISRLEQDPAAVPAAPATTRDDMAAALRELQTRRITAFSAGNGLGLSSKDQLALIAEATTADDIDLLNDAVRMLDEFSKTVATLHTDVWREFAKGQRCSVCGMTSKQAAAARYDCAREC